MPNALWAGYLNENPQAAYFSYGNQWKSPNAKRYYQSLFGNIQDQYMGRLGQMIGSGGAPNLDFTDFLKQFDWGQNYQLNAPQSQRGNTSQFNPWTRWMI